MPDEVSNEFLLYSCIFIKDVEIGIPFTVNFNVLRGRMDDLNNYIFIL